VRSPLAALRALSGRIVIAIVVCALVMGAAVFRINTYIDDRIDEIPRVQLTTASATGTATNFLIIGSDTRSFVQSEADKQAFTDSDTTADGPARSDTMMVLHADGDASYVVSFPRDLMVNVPTLGRQKINAAFNKGPQLVIDTLQQDFNVPINHYLEVNFKSFEDIVNAVGSVPVWFPYPVRDQLSGLKPFPYGPGCYALDGATSLAYVRSRHLEYYENGKWVDASGRADIDRIARQQDFIKRLGRIAMAKATDDPSITPDLADHLIPNLTADQSFDRESFNELVRAFMGLSESTDAGPTFATLPWERATRSGQDVLVEKQPEADAMLAVLRGEAPIPTTTTAPPAGSDGGGNAPAVRPSDVRVVVRNGSGVQNAAGNTAQELQQKGFVNGGAENNPAGLVDSSEIHYGASDLAKAQLLQSIVPGAQLVEDSSRAGTDIVLVLGKDFHGLGTTATTGAPGATTTTLSPEAACV
jgi:LCP family protein required for cell wall assembly